jgi:hypothetical protein
VGRRSLVAVAVFAAVLTGAAAARAQAPTGDAVIGSGTARFFTPDLFGLTVPFSIDVRAGPSGENPVGSMQLFIAFDDPTCFVIRSGGGQIADEAAINFRNTLLGGRVVARITGGTSGPRVIALAGTSSPTDCSFYPPSSAAEVIEGDVRIFDAPPRPTSKDQCKNGGWRSYAGFKNQGDCVRSVTPQ